MLAAVLAHIDAHGTEYLAELFPLLRQPSISATGDGMPACAELLARMMEDAGLAARILPTAGHPVVFGDTGAPHLHHMLARLRAVETRRDLVRAVNTGISGLVLATGEDEHRTEPFVRTSFVAEVRLLRGWTTPWVRFGDLVTPALLGLLGGIALARRRAP